MTRTDIRDYFGRHVKAREIEAALRVLEEGLAERQKRNTGGGPVELWRARHKRQKRAKGADNRYQSRTSVSSHPTEDEPSAHGDHGHPGTSRREPLVAHPAGEASV